ncbi:ras association domain-containing protein 10-like [Centruroides vittatus]|uniref:ras association domain-containing protein 10-like n=1 Tax=Centruroides vittatus TaxID=120091 RepID=UPI0035107866
MGTDIPLWIGGFKKWVIGVNKHTTCEDIVRAVLASNDVDRQHRHRRDNRNYTIVERWRKVERPLDSKSRILKVWKTWGDEQCNVRFLMKKVHHPTIKDYRTHRRKHLKIVNRLSKSNLCHHSEEVKLSTEYTDLSIEELKKVIRRQNENLSEQLKSLEEKDDEIDYYETKIHLIRMHQIGANYVQDTYLGGSDEEDSSALQSDSNEIIQQVIQMYEKLLDTCKRLESEKRTISQLTSEIKNLGDKLDSSNNIDEEIERIRQRLNELVNVVEKQDNIIKENEKSLTDITKSLHEKNHCIQILETDLEKLENESLRLQHDYDIVHGLQPDKKVVKTKSCDVTNEGVDSNSDTGLSSLHSSSDDCVVVLDTLV